MTYCAAIFGLEHIGIPTHPTPLVYCDGDGCGATHEVMSARGAVGRPFAWFLNGKAKPGWRVENADGNSARRDWCPACVAKRGSAT